MESEDVSMIFYMAVFVPSSLELACLQRTCSVPLSSARSKSKISLQLSYGSFNLSNENIMVNSDNITLLNFVFLITCLVQNAMTL